MKPALVPNPDYKTPDQKGVDFLRTAALMGMRGEFQLLLTARSKTEEEKAESFASAAFCTKPNITMPHYLASIKSNAKSTENSKPKTSHPSITEINPQVQSPYPALLPPPEHSQPPSPLPPCS